MMELISRGAQVQALPRSQQTHITFPSLGIAPLSLTDSVRRALVDQAEAGAIHAELQLSKQWE